MKFFTFAAFVFLTACGGSDVSAPVTPDRETDFSSQMVSESEMNANGCIFKSSEGGYKLECQMRDTALDEYRQRISLLRYQILASNIWRNGINRTPTGGLINEKSLQILSRKWSAVYAYINLPDGVENDARKLFWFQHIELPSSQEEPLCLVLGRLLAASQNSQVIVDLDDQFNVQITNPRGEEKHVRNFKNLAVEVIEKFAGTHLLVEKLKAAVEAL